MCVVVKCVYRQPVVVVVHHTYRQNVPMLFTRRVINGGVVMGGGQWDDDRSLPAERTIKGKSELDSESPNLNRTTLTLFL